MLIMKEPVIDNGTAAGYAGFDEMKGVKESLPQEEKKCHIPVYCHSGMTSGGERSDNEPHWACWY